ncbi:MAG TPA: hypothetical protein VM889_05530 [Candidatus Thermoplasmatota archaeon]|nr:hypothetical protein [Candidatus Thermoplasmatota archaeon]
MPVFIREASTVVVDAPADAVARVLEARGARRAGIARYEGPGGGPRGPLDARREAWYVLRATPQGTEVVHGVALAPANLAENLAARLRRARLATGVERHLVDLKREAEREAGLRRAFPPLAP